VFLGDNLVSWSSKHKNIVSRSSAEAEYRAMANGVAEACWLRQLLQEVHAPLSKGTLVYYDNISAVYLSANPVQHQRTKHIEIDLHSFINALPSVMSASYTYRRPPSSRTSSRRVYPLQCFQNFGPVSTLAVDRVSTAEVLANVLFYRYMSPGPPPAVGLT
jgi:hypothetical protein